MTNEQLAVYLRQLHERLVSEIDILDGDLDGADRHTVYTRKADAPILASVWHNPEHFDQEDCGHVVALDDLRMFAVSIQTDINLLLAE